MTSPVGPKDLFIKVEEKTESAYQPLDNTSEKIKEWLKENDLSPQSLSPIEHSRTPSILSDNIDDFHLRSDGEYECDWVIEGDESDESYRSYRSEVSDLSYTMGPPHFKIRSDYGLFTIHQNHSENKFFKLFLEKDPTDPFRSAVIKHIATNCGLYFSYNLYPDIPMPTEEGVKWIANRHKKKYGIIIKTKTLGDVKDCFKKIQRKLSTKGYPEQYVGIVITNLTQSLHVTPLLCYFNQKDRSKNEFVILDSIGQSGLVEEHLKYLGIDEKKIYFTNKMRQANYIECRIEACEILLHALLSIKHHNHTNGFSEALKGAIIGQDNIIDEVPLDWDYTAPIRNKQQGADKTLIPRHFFSENTNKKTMTVEEHRKKYTQSVVITYRVFQKDKFAHEDEFQSLKVPSDVKIIELSKNSFEIEFALTRDINTFLTQKAIKSYTKYKGKRVAL